MLEIVDFKDMTGKEFFYAEDHFFYVKAQRELFPKEINTLANNKHLPRTSNLLSLQLFLSDNLP